MKKPISTKVNLDRDFSLAYFLLASLILLKYYQIINWSWWWVAYPLFGGLLFEILGLIMKTMLYFWDMKYFKYEASRGDLLHCSDYTGTIISIATAVSGNKEIDVDWSYRYLIGNEIKNHVCFSDELSEKEVKKYRLLYLKNTSRGNFNLILGVDRG